MKKNFFYLEYVEKHFITLKHHSLRCTNLGFIAEQTQKVKFIFTKKLLKTLKTCIRILRRNGSRNPQL